MKILKIEWRNFNSYGNSKQEITFGKDNGSLNLLVGRNGHGKSTIAEIITFAIYGKVDGKKMSDLPNRINKELWVKITMICKKKKVEIERGISPGLFDVWIDGNSYDEAGKSNMQDRLETEFYDLSFQVFKNIIVLSIEDFKSFLTMTPGDKRNIIDRLFGFSIINQMRDSLKLERKIVKDNIKTLEDELNMVEDSIQSIESKIEILKESKEINTDSRKTEITNNLKNLKSTYEKTQDKLSKLKDSYNKINEDLKNVRSLSADNSSKIQNIDRRLKLYDNKQCPTCGSDLHSGSPLEIKNKLLTIKNKLESESPKIKKDLKSAQDQMDKVQKFQVKINSDINKVQTSISNYKKELQSLLSSSEEGEFEHLKDLLSELDEKQSSKVKNKENKDLQNEFLQIVENVLGEDGVKNLALKTILPPLNAHIAKMANQMHLPYQITFDNKFNCIVMHMGQKISPKTLSTGQRKKSDFIIVVALIKLMKVRFPSMNLLFLDELLSSVDASGRHEIIKILRNTVKDHNLDAWLINHSELPVELFDKKVEAVLEGGFSKINIEEIK